MTFSIIGHCPDSGQLGIAVCSDGVAVGARSLLLRSQVGVVSSLNSRLPFPGRHILDLIEQGVSPDIALKTGLNDDKYLPFHQVVVFASNGLRAFYSGQHIPAISNVAIGENCVAAGHSLVSQQVITDMTNAFEKQQGQLTERLIAAMIAGVKAGGETGRVHSSALSVIGELLWPVVDLRVDWTEGDPVQELDLLWQAYKPQMQDYITRALNPESAPGYGVPGDE
ncbi:DUF1028 domain-containing protein [Tatumella citrea]|uniref:Fimbrial assembly protein FimA n=1 Tax=Tatumella citrea TaxID=53336 RepID=A0A1Y0LJN2_TATCI|nr:DUF1028 domain-containing protein [Tatumella citrea]ARU94029.1 fimbrial assembly protein FimA [Tatumella citrea]ARU98067.1 fimbrial assembly protein FimA [Tatumella citrea]